MNVHPSVEHEKEVKFTVNLVKVNRGLVKISQVLEQINLSEAARVGNQAANHVFLVVHTDDCYRDYEKMKSNGVHFFGEPKELSWGIEVVFEDLYGNRMDLVQHNGY